MILAGRLPLLIFAAALGAAWWRALPPATPEFAAGESLAATSATGSGWQSTPLILSSPAAVSAPTLAELPDGRLVAAWQATATHNENTIHLAHWQSGQWSTPRLLIDRQLLRSATQARIGHFGRPQLHAQGNTLHLWLASRTPMGSVPHHLESADGGQHWSAPQRLATTPLFNAGNTPVATPLALADGGIALPLSHALLARHGEWLRLDAQGRILDKTRLPLPAAARLIGIAPLDSQRALAVLRDTASGHPRLLFSENAGQRWQVRDTPAELSHREPLALLRQRHGALLLLASASTGEWQWLRSIDAGVSWQRVGRAFAGTGTPAVIESRDGAVHLLIAGTDGLRHLRLTPDWLNEVQP